MFGYLACADTSLSWNGREAVWDQSMAIPEPIERADNINAASLKNWLAKTALVPVRAKG
jgi:hypothetical protein